jgi:thioredoxin 1
MNIMPKHLFMPTTLSKMNFQTALDQTKKLSLVQFKTEWSGACQIIDPIYQDLAKSYKGLVDFFTIDAEAEKELHDRYAIVELPTILFFSSGQVIDHVIGLTSKNKLIAKIENALSLLN